MSLILMDDCLISLEHSYTQDRMRKILFDRVESLVIWRTTSWVRISLMSILLGLPAIGILFIREFASTIIALIFLAFVAVVIARYFYCGRTTIRITRAGQAWDITGIFTPSRVRRFQERLVAGIRSIQQAGMDSSSGAAAVPDAPTAAPAMPVEPPPGQ